MGGVFNLEFQIADRRLKIGKIRDLETWRIDFRLQIADWTLMAKSNSEGRRRKDE